MKVAVLGTGFMGKVHIEAFKQIEGVELVGVFTKSSNREELAIYNCSIYNSFEKLVEEQQPDVVSICLPSYLHKEYVIKSSKLGLHVICEKPIALSLDDAQEMITSCEENKVRLFIGHVLRFFPEYQQLKKSVDQGDVGDIGVLHARRANEHPGITSKWYHDESKSGGVMLDLVIHDLDFMRYLNGEVKSVFARNQKRDNIDVSFITLKFENGVIGNVEALWAPLTNLEYSFEVYGSKGVIHLTNERKPIQLKKVNQPITEINLNGEEPYRMQLKHFIECIQQEKESIVTVYDAYEAIKLSLAAIESTQTGKPVELRGGFTEKVN